MAVLLSGIIIFVVMIVIAVVSWIVGTLRSAADQPPLVKILVVVGVLGTIITTICYLCDDTVV